MWLVGVEVVGSEGGIRDLVELYGDSYFGPFRGYGVDFENS